MRLSARTPVRGTSQCVHLSTPLSFSPFGPEEASCVPVRAHQCVTPASAPQCLHTFFYTPYGPQVRGLLCGLVRARQSVHPGACTSVLAHLLSYSFWSVREKPPVRGLPPNARKDLLTLHLPTRIALNEMGVDLTALISPKPGQASSANAPGPTQTPSGSPFPDVLSYTYVSPAQYSRLQQALHALSNASEASAAAIQSATSPAALPTSPLPSHPEATSSKEQQPPPPQQQQRPDEVVAAAARISNSYQAVIGACEQLRLGGQGSEGRMSAEEIAQRLKVLAEVDPQLVEAAYDVEAVQQIRQLGTRSTEQKEAQLWWDALQRYKATHGDTFGSPSIEGGEGGSKTGKRASEVMREGGAGPARHSWEAIAAWLDVYPGGKVYHRGSGERQISRMPSFPAFEGLPLSTIDSLEEGDLSALNRSKAQVHEAQLCQDFEADLLYNLGLRGDGLRDVSMPRSPPNLASSLDEAPMVVYDITREGQTVHPPLYVLDQGGRRPLNEQELVFQERRLRDVQADQFPWLRPHYTMRRIKRKPELQ
ncbi:hypothetical protein DUNSADRAFT_14393 [Dunaliella salina]|uniref:Uncharacterized protein n=1 Tax=Dunaliella salina TaxID=3046 RepID=A0ABQ7G7E8_DUNSA|nr:hypothetical protein DUNSADRAFT_14393 [Dunaliella salina]|eukprot:KAF5830523.1 hypothetical protein DUNSADRAFT_14393 [Dunaliella salina]